MSGRGGMKEEVFDSRALKLQFFERSCQKKTLFLKFLLNLLSPLLQLFEPAEDFGLCFG